MINSIGTALCTPIFPAIGFVNICLRFMLPNEQLRTALSASIGSILSFACWTIVPFAYDIAPLLLPFAISNGVCVGVGYALLDVTAGGPKSLKHPFVGGGLGALTGFAAPYYLYGEAYNVLYGIEGVTPLIQHFMAAPFVTEILCTTGFVAGTAMYPLLHYPMFGIKSVPWTNFSGLLLVSSIGMVYALYATDTEKNANIAPVGSYVNPEIVPLLNSMVRFNTETAQFEAYSLSSNKEWVGSPDCYKKGQIVTKQVREYQQQNDYWGERCTFDHPMLGYLCHYFDRGIAQRFKKSLVTLMDERDINKLRDTMHQTDLVVASILDRSRNNIQEKSFVEKNYRYLIDHENLSKRWCLKLLKSAEKASLGVELIIAMKENGTDKVHLRHSNTTVSSEDIEKWIRNTSPGLLLYQSDESQHVRGQSIENQLSRLSWTCTNLNKATDKWENAIMEDSSSRRRNVFLTSSFLATILSAIALYNS